MDDSDSKEFNGGGDNFGAEHLKKRNLSGSNSSKEIRRAVEQCLSSSSSTLDISRKNIKHLTKEIHRLPSIKYFHLEGNVISMIPEDLFQKLPHLVWLDLRYNKIKALPPGIGYHRQLKTLLLERNPIKELPTELGNLTSLTALNLRHCPLEFPPKDVIRKGLKSILCFLRDSGNGKLLCTEPTASEMPPVEKLNLSELLQSSLDLSDEWPNEEEKQRFQKLKEEIIKDEKEGFLTYERVGATHDFIEAGKNHRKKEQLYSESASLCRTIQAKRAEKCRSVAEKELEEEQALFEQTKKQVLQWYKKFEQILLKELVYISAYFPTICIHLDCFTKVLLQNKCISVALLEAPDGSVMKGQCPGFGGAQGGALFQWFGLTSGVLWCSLGIPAPGEREKPGGEEQGQGILVSPSLPVRQGMLSAEQDSLLLRNVYLDNGSTRRSSLKLRAETKKSWRITADIRNQKLFVVQLSTSSLCSLKFTYGKNCNKEMLQEWRSQVKLMEEEKEMFRFSPTNADMIPKNAPHATDNISYYTVEEGAEKRERTPEIMEERLLKVKDEATRSLREKKLEQRIKQHTQMMKARGEKLKGTSQVEMKKAKQDVETVEDLQTKLAKTKRGLLLREYRLTAFTGEFPADSPRMQTQKIFSSSKF
ncbi:leucine-rich repeat-containing protein 27 [Sarcoramphus papa]